MNITIGKSKIPKKRQSIISQLMALMPEKDGRGQFIEFINIDESARLSIANSMSRQKRDNKAEFVSQWKKEKKALIGCFKVWRLK